MRQEPCRTLSRGGKESDLFFAGSSGCVSQRAGQGCQGEHREPSGEADASPGLAEAGGSGGGEQVTCEMYAEGGTNSICKCLNGEGRQRRKK